MRHTRRILMLAGLAALVVSAVAGPVVAKEKAPTGDLIGLFGGDQTYPANTPFYISHGDVSLADEDAAIGRANFDLDVDGVAVPATYETRVESDGSVTHLWVFNFPNGMTGTHSFTGHWYAACGVATNFFDCNGATPTTPVEYSTVEITLTFG